MSSALPSGAPCASLMDVGPAVIDVIIAAWNRADTIERAILSVVNERCVRSVLVVDDASTDETAARAQAVAHRHDKVKVTKAMRNGGPSAARNHALAAATAPWIAILDADDYMLPGRLERLIEASNGWDIVADDLLQVPDGHRSPHLGNRLLDVDDTWQFDVTFEQFVCGNLQRRGRPRREMGFLKPIMRRHFLETHDLHYDPTLRLGEDYVLYARALAGGARFRILPAAGYVSVMRPDSLSARHGRRDLEALLACDRTLLSLPHLSRAERRAVRSHIGDLEKKILWLRTIEAVKTGAVSELVGALARTPQAASYVAGNLVTEAWRRLSHRVAGQPLT